MIDLDPRKMARQVADLILRQVQEQGSLHQENIREAVCSAMNPCGAALQEEEQERLIAELEAHYQTVIGIERELIGDDEGWAPWLQDRRASIDPKFWKRYDIYCQNDGFSPPVMNRLRESTDRALGLLGDPNRSGAWDRRGLVVGLVQSGKTAHYIGLINKALDSGYKIIFVLTGFTDSLREQTQERVDEGVLGYSQVEDPVTSDSRKAVGVHLLDPSPPPPDSATTQKRDFNKQFATQFGQQIGINPIIFVVKKNASVLKNLLSYVSEVGNQEGEGGQRFHAGVPALIIDDESDVGSVDTKGGAVDPNDQPDPDHDPTKINKQIRKLVRLFEQVSYVGYTATPFANVLMHEEAAAGVDPADGLVIGKDLFPRSFIVSLPTPSNHVGPAMIFGCEGEDLDRGSGLPIIRHVKDSEIGNILAECWMPRRHKITHVPVYIGESKIPPSLEEAICSYILSCAARWLRGDAHKHMSMLVHATRFVRVQDHIREQVDDYLYRMREKLRNKVNAGSLLRLMQDLWERGDECFLEVTRQISEREGALFQNPRHEWGEIEPLLLEVVSKIDVRTIHGASGESLDYKNYPEGLNVIAIGGAKLSRGLTLEGLSTSYFLRPSKMYDTLMQMGRWFGYRDGFIDLCRLYTTPEIDEWFAHIAMASQELRVEFDRMSVLRKTPKEFGLRIRSHPHLMVTARAKCRYGELRTESISFEGHRLQTIEFFRNSKVVRSNFEVAKKLVLSAEDEGTLFQAQTTDNKYVWCGVSTSSVLKFLSDYEVHPSAIKLDKRGMRVVRSYIEAQQAAGGLVRWTVLLQGGEESQHSVAGRSLKMVHRKWASRLGEGEKEALIRDDHFQIGSLTNPADEKAGLDNAAIERANELTRQAAAAEGRHAPREPSAQHLRYVRPPEEGLICLYPLSPTKRRAESEALPIMAFQISFPSAVTKVTPVTYIANHVEQLTLFEED